MFTNETELGDNKDISEILTKIEKMFISAYKQIMNEKLQSFGQKLEEFQHNIPDDIPEGLIYAKIFRNLWRTIPRFNANRLFFRMLCIN